MSWSKDVRGREITFRILTELADFELLEPIQRDVMGASDLDIIPGSELVVCAETGGHALGAYVDGDLAGGLYAFGGYFNQKPRIVSDWMGIWPQYRSMGIGTELKRLQAAIALKDGFEEIVWTVDPLRAANARLNFERLGAWSDHYEENRYGRAYATGLYGGMPSDRLHLTLTITDPTVQERLAGGIPPRSAADVYTLEHFNPRESRNQALIFIPSDIDRLVETDLNAAMRWRLTLRETLQHAFEDGFVIRGFVPNLAGDGDLSAYVIERKSGV